ncbi:hypothetical protein [Streptomyces omiyaensis]|uniref:Uncharacterized protein n=1 Tax=Streptomyces omiyaensis TaxID=68247 RepID=A0ABW7C7F2_9ACTN|nr:hypothetical protein [Streptomyces omiyaensis]GGY83237.1 hypothetical protein GCM10010363_74820 [Streptomyces omiyaensis]
MTLSHPVRRTGIRTGATMAAATAIAGISLVGAPAAHAAPGDSGDLNIRSAGWHSQGRDGAQVCAFRLVASNFESLPAVPWTITEQPPTVPPGDTLVSTLPLINGEARSDRYLLPEGTYQLVWTVPAGPKNRSFKIDCDNRAAAQGSNRPARPADAPAAVNSAADYKQPNGGVPAGGGAVPDLETLSAEEDSSFGTGVALTAGAVGIAALVMARRSAVRRARNEA